MLHKRLVNALKKVGIQTEVDGNGFKAVAGERMLNWYTQASYKYPGEVEVTVLYYPHPESNPQFDNFCDVYFHSIKDAVRFLSPKAK